MDLSKELRDPWGTLEGPLRCTLGFAERIEKDLGMKHAAACNLEYLEGMSLRISELHNSTPKIQLIGFLPIPQVCEFCCRGWDFRMISTSNHLACESVVDNPDLSMSLETPIGHENIAIRDIKRALASLNLSDMEDFRLMKAWEVSRSSNPGKSQLQHLVGMYETHSTSMMLEPRRPSSKAPPRLQLHWKRAGRRSQKIHHPLWRTSVYPMGNSRLDGWHTAIMIIMEMKMMKYTTSSLGLYCSLNLFDPSAAAEETSPKIIQNSSSKFSKWSLSVYPFPLAVLPGSSASFRRSAWPEIVGERLVDRGL